MIVKPEHIERFAEDGAVCIRQIVDSSWIERMRKAIARVLEGESTGTAPRFRTLLFLWKTDPDFRDFSLASPLPEIAASIIQSNEVRLFADQLLVKEAGTAEKTPWHQDLPYWPIRGNQLCTIWVAFDPVTLESGAVEYIRGSHRWGKWYKPAAFSPGRKWETPDWEDAPDFDARRGEFEFLHWDVEPGDCIIHHPLVVHGASGNSRLDRQRRAVAPRYAGEDVRWMPAQGFRAAASVSARDPGLAHGSPLDSPEYPRVWPSAS